MGNFLIPQADHQGLAIKIPYLATLIKITNQGLPIHPRRGFSFMSLKISLAEPHAAVSAPLRFSLNPVSLSCLVKDFFLLEIGV